MANRLGIEMLTLMGMPPVDHIKLAAELGCVSISTGLMRMPMAMFGMAELYPDWSLVEDKALRGEVKAALADTGVHIGLGEGFRVDPAFDVADKFPEQLDVMAELGAWRINAISTDPDESRWVDQFGKLSDMVMARGMRFLVEFAPTQALDNPAAALRVADALGHDRCGMMLDAMHFFRSGGTVEQVAGLPVIYAQLCDVPLVSQADSYMQEAMFGRRVPGEGELPIADWIAALPADCEIGLEVPNMARLESLGAKEHARGCVEAARRLGA